jgi:hypothetical protein
VVASVRRIRIGLLVPLVALLSCGASTSGNSAPATPPAAASDQLIWEGTSGGFQIRWTTRDVAATKAGASEGAAFSLARDLTAAYEREAAARAADEAKTGGPSPANPCTWQGKVEVLSIVGSIVSYRVTRSITCEHEAHPSGESRLVSIDLATAGATGGSPKPLTLADLFSEASVLAALRNDPLVKQVIRSDEDAAKTLPGLVQALSSGPPVLDDKACFAFPDDLLSRFAFHHLEDGSVAVRVGLPGAAPCRENLTFLGILLPVPRSLSEALAAAATKSEGFLMKDPPASAKGRQTIVTYKTAR